MAEPFRSGKSGRIGSSDLRIKQPFGFSQRIATRFFGTPPLTESQKDNFNDNSLDSAKWINLYGARIVETSNQLQISTITTAGYYALETATSQSLYNSSVSVRLVNAGNQALTTYECYPLSISNADFSNKAEFVIATGTVFMFTRIGGVPTNLGGSFAYSAVTHAYFRMREKDGLLIFETSADGATWTQRRSIPNPFSLNAIKVLMQAGNYGVEASGTTAIFDDYNGHINFKQATVNAADIPASQTNFPAYVDLSRLGITSLQQAQSVRVYADPLKAVEWPREIVAANEMHVKIPSITSTTKMYIYYDAIEPDYTDTHPLGRNVVWSDYRAVYHFEHASGDALDSSGNGFTLTNTTSKPYTAAGIGRGIDFGSTVRNTTELTTASQILASANGAMSYSVRFKQNTSVQTASNPGLFQLPFKGASGSSTSIIPEWNAGAPRISILRRTNTDINARTNFGNSTSDYYHVVSVFDGANLNGYLDGTVFTTSNIAHSGTFNASAYPISLGGSYTSNNATSIIDEVRVRLSALSANWITSESKNLNAEATFWGTWSDVGGVAYSSVLTESIVVVDVIRRTPSRRLIDAVTVVDIVQRTTNRLITEALTIVDTFAGSKVLVRSYGEAITVVDTVAKSTSRTLLEAMTIIDIITKTSSRFLSEAVTVVDVIAKRGGKSLVEAITVVDTVAKLTTRRLIEAFTIIDTVIRTTTRLFTETITVVDSYSRVIGKSLKEWIILYDGDDTLKNGTMASQPPFTAATVSNNGRWIDGTASGSLTDDTWGWGTMQTSGGNLTSRFDTIGGKPCITLQGVGLSKSGGTVSQVGVNHANVYTGGTVPLAQRPFMIPVKEGVTYRFGGEYYLQSVNNPTQVFFKFTVIYYDKDLNRLGAGQLNTADANNANFNTWTTLAITGAAPTGAAFVIYSAKIMAGGADGSGHDMIVSFTNVYFEKNTAVDSIKIFLSRTLTESVVLVDRIIRTSTRRLIEAITIVDTFAFTRAISRVYTESLVLVDTIRKTASKVLREAITLADILDAFILLGRSIGNWIVYSLTGLAKIVKGERKSQTLSTTKQSHVLLLSERSFTVSATDITHTNQTNKTP